MPPAAFAGKHMSSSAIEAPCFRVLKAVGMAVLAAVGHVNIAPWMHERLADPEADVRSRAASALGLLGDMEAGDELTAALADAEWPVRAMAAKALGMSDADAQRLVDQYAERRADWVEQVHADELMTSGEGLDANLQTARHAIERLDPDGEMRKMLRVSGLGDNPVMVRFALRVGQALRR